MSKNPFSKYDMSNPQADYLFEIFNSLKENYSVEIDSEFLLDIKKFVVFENNELNDYGPVLKISTNFNSFNLNFIEISYRTGGKYSSLSVVEYQCWGSIDLNNNFGHIFIKPETFIDKIYDLVNSIDLDFEDDKEFSRGFLVVTDDKLKAQSQIKEDLRKYIKEIELKEFVIEIIDRKLIIGDKKVISQESVFQFAEFLDKVARTFI